MLCRHLLAEALVTETEAAVQADPGYIALKQGFEEARAVAVRAEQKLELAKDEIDRVSMPLDQLANLYPQDLRAIQKMLDSVSTAHEQLMAVPIHSPDGKGLLILQKDELSVQDLVVLR